MNRKHFGVLVLLLVGVVGSASYMAGTADAQQDRCPGVTTILSGLGDMNEKIERLTDEVEKLHGRKRWYVSRDCGNDSNPGTRDEPLATLSAASEKAGPGDTIAFEASKCPKPKCRCADNPGTCQGCLKEPPCEECCKFCADARQPYIGEKIKENCFCGGVR